MIRPTQRTIHVAAGLLPLAALPTLLGVAGWWWAFFAGWVGLVLLLLWEWSRLPVARSLRVAVHVPSALRLLDADAVVVNVDATAPGTGQLLLDLSGPHATWDIASCTWQADTTAVVRFPLLSERRGTICVERWHLGVQGPLGLLRSEFQGVVGKSILVLPNAPLATRKALQMLERRELRAGARIERYLGDGSEFASLRDFVSGMDRRSVDWKATARHRTLLCREYRAERDHNIILCLDTGRLMGEPLHGLPRLDHAIQAALQLGYVGLHTGDRVGLHAFAGKPLHYLAPQAGMPAMNAVAMRCAQLDYRPEEANFTLAVTDLLQRLTRRSLVVLFTEFVDAISAELMLRNVQWLARRHVLLFVAMRDPLVGELIAQPPRGFADVHRSVVAGEIGSERQLVLERLRNLGAQVVDCGAAELAVDLVQRYLAVKRRELV